MWIAGGLGKNNVSEMVGELLECVKKQEMWESRNT